MKRDEAQAMTRVNFENILLRERSQVTKYVSNILYESSCMKCQEQRHSQRQKVDQQFPGLGGGRSEGVALKGILFLWKVFCSYTVLMIICPREHVKKKKKTAELHTLKL